MRKLASCSLLLVATLSAQGYVSPSTHVHSEGSLTQSFPFGIATVPFRYMQIHDDLPVPTVINGLAFRHNAGGTNNTIYPAHSLTMDVWVSTAATTSATASTAYASNHGVDRTQVGFNRTYGLPESDPTNLPGDFVLDFPFDTPFVYVGGGSLCWEVVITAKTQTSSIFYDAVNDGAVNPPMQVARGGDGCLATGASQPMDVTCLGPLDWTTGAGTFNTVGNRLLANGVVLLVRGLDKGAFQGQPLPLAIPTSANGPSGPCTLYLNPLLAQVGIATSTGSCNLSSSFTAPITLLQQLNGMTVYSQVLGLDLAANPFGVTSSKMAMHNIVAPYGTTPIARVYRSGDIVNPIGILQNTNCLVTKFN